MGRACGSFGELLQGALPDEGRAFLVTLPIACFSTARFWPDEQSTLLDVIPPHKQKARLLGMRLLRHLGWHGGGMLQLDTDLPVGKGCASSSADLVAAARAIQCALGVQVPRSTLGRLLAGIEPTDGVMYDGIVAFHHRDGLLLSVLGPTPRLEILAVDDGGQVDTVAFNRHAQQYTAAEQETHAALLAEAGRAVKAGDLCALGRVATCSARLHQRVLPKGQLDLLTGLAERHGAVGVVAAHSGTYAGILLDPAAPDHASRSSTLHDELAACGLAPERFETLSAPCPAPVL
jgi:L-threonine kinase